MYKPVKEKRNHERNYTVVSTVGMDGTKKSTKFRFFSEDVAHQGNPGHIVKIASGLWSRGGMR